MEVSNNEFLYQKIYDLERTLNAAESMKNLMQQEIDSLQNQLKNDELNFQDFKEKTKSELTDKWIQKVSSLNCELDEERELSSKTITNLKEKLSNLEKKQSPVVESPTDQNMKEKFHNLLEDNCILRENLEEMKLLLESSNQEKIENDLKVKNLEKSCEETNEILECKKGALIQATEALKDLQEEKALLSNELAILKANPGDENNRGNSLFAEVDDNRKALMKNITLLKNKLREANIKLLNKSEEISKLRTDNDRLHHKIKENDRVLKPEYLKLLESYKSRVQELELLVCKLENQEVEPKNISNENQRLCWLSNSLERTRNEATLFQREYNEVFRKQVEEAEQLMDSQQEIRKLKTQLVSFEKSGVRRSDKQNGELDEEKEISAQNSTKILKEVRFSEDVR